MGTQAAVRAEALTRATTGQALSNYPAIYAGFLAMGIPEADIKPRENILTFNAWKALGRHVRKGQHGVKVCTWVEMTRKAEKPGEAPTVSKRPWTTTVFHISQTDPDTIGRDGVK